MLTDSKIALSLALVLATASAATAAPKQPVRPNTAIEGSHPSLDSVSSTRYAAIRACWRQSHAQAPVGVYGVEATGTAHALIYRSCMQQKGFVP
jgi:hypothetical protein